MNKPRLSIIITILNGEKTIAKCLSSIYQQLFVDYEVIIVDGGSADQTVDTINLIKLTNTKLYLVPKIGLYAGLNYGIKMSTGQWLYFMGCDDELFEQDTLQKVMRFIDIAKKDIKVFVGGVNCVKQKNLLKPKFGSPYFLKYQVHHQGMFYDRSLFSNLLYDENMRIASDYEFNLKLWLSNVKHQKMNFVISNFGGDGVSENQNEAANIEMQQVHSQLFNGIYKTWVVKYFHFNRKIIVLRRKLNLLNIKFRLKNLFISLTTFKQ